MASAPSKVRTSPGLDPRLGDVRLLVRRGKVRAGLDALILLDPSLAAGGFDRPDHAAFVALGIECLLARGDLSIAVRWGERIDDYAVGPGAATALHARAELASAEDAPERALELYLGAGIAAQESAPESHVPWRVGAALALVRCGRRREAVELSTAELDLALERHDAHDTAGALRTLAATAADGRAVRRLEDARGLLGRNDSRRLAAQIDTDLAGLMVLTGNVPRATALLRDAELYAAHEDLWPLQSRVRRLLERIGELPVRLESEALSVLTHAERRVAVLALDGLTNRQIAEQLIVSVKAVEGHLSRVYRKLGVGSRGALGATIGRRD